MQLKSERESKFLDLLRPVHASAERFVRTLVADRDEARDVLQDAIVIVWQKLDDIRDHSAFKSYLFTVITNVSRHHFKKNKRYHRMAEGAEEELESHSPLPDRLTEATLVREALNLLPEKSREAIILFEVNDLSVEEISKIQSSSVSAVKVRLMRARRLLASKLGIPIHSQLNRGNHVNLQNN